MTNASNAFLVDSNILVYAHDPRDQRKQLRAIGLMNELVARGTGVLSVQCLSEFFNTVTRKLPERVSAADALLQVEHLAISCRMLDLTLAVALEGYRGATRYQLSIWDALIWATAKLNEVPYVLSEDLQHGVVLEGVRIQNPFLPEFDMALLEHGG